jgi:VWFA-related protein
MRPFAARAALAYVSTLSPPHDYAGVFLADATLRTFQSFTNQAARLREGVAGVTSTAPVSLAAGAERAATTRVQSFDPNQPPTAGAESAGGFSNAERQALFDPARDRDPATLLLRLELKMGEGYQRFASEYEGQASMTGLRAVIDALGALPGRKSVLYFTENLQITPRLKAKFDALIGQANRSNITVYPVDAAGLRVHSKEAELARNVNVAGSQAVGDERRGDGPWTKDLEKQDQLLSSRPTAALGRLAKETGGFLLENTNDLAAGVARMQQERTTYYLLGYQPTNTAMDGTFRKVTVKVKRSKTTVKARPGYLAAPPR